MTSTRRVVQVDVSGADVELASDALWRAGPSGVSEVSLPDGRVRLTADVADPAAIEPPWTVAVIEAGTDDHLDAWRAWAAPVRAGRSVVLQPAWLPPGEADPGDVVVLLDPGRTFGSGSHPSTRLVAAALEDLVHEGEQVLDVGCGSGVLAVTALCLDAATAVGVDVDPAAPEVARANAGRNGVEDRLRVTTRPVSELTGLFGVVVANIGQRVLVDLAPSLVARVRPGGFLVLSGLLDEQADVVVSACHGCAELERRRLEGWVAPILVRQS
ncbi:MAG: 50S ribosomal protein L11 methyltransferase [Acidimicrobiales bacterium]